MAMRQPVVAAIIGAAVILGCVGLRFALRSSAPAPSAKLEPGPRRPAPRTYDEQLDGRRYVNRDLGLALSGPENWTVSLGSRSEDRPAYEGLVLKMTPPNAGGPIVSIVRQPLGPQDTRDPLEFIRKRLLSDRKTVTEAPARAVIAGMSVGRVAYTMGSLRAVQVVRMTAAGALILTAVAPADRFDEVNRSFEQILSTVKFDS